MSFADLQLVDTSATEITPRERSEALGRAVNVVVAAVAMVLLLPLMVLVAVAIKLTSSGPVFYSQTRVGLGPAASSAQPGRTTVVRPRRKTVQDVQVQNDARGRRDRRVRCVGAEE
jgi:lipopolysaccharide/colanic/teichoic acid biosynthesis glycosyltransferase